MQILGRLSPYRACSLFNGAIRHCFSTDSGYFSETMDTSPETWKKTLVPYCNRLFQLLEADEKYTFQSAYGNPSSIDIEKIEQFAKVLLAFAANPQRYAGVETIPNNYFWGIIAPEDLERFAGTSTNHLATLEHRMKTMRDRLQKFPPAHLSLIHLGEVATNDFFSAISNLDKEGLRFKSIIAIEESLGAVLHAEAYNRLCARIPNLTLCASKIVPFLESNCEALQEKKAIIVGTENATRIFSSTEKPEDNLERLIKVARKILHKDMPFILEYLPLPKQS